VARVVVEAVEPRAQDRLERGFTRGLDHVLAGVAASVSR
jgi:hypothetical protein